MQQSISVPEISCEHCKTTIEGALRSLEGVSRATVEVEAKKVEVVFDPGLVSSEQLIAAIEDAGYEVPVAEVR
jgi:copper chaperone